MSKYLLLALLSLLTFNVNAQKIDFTDTTNEWFVLHKGGASSAGVMITSFAVVHYFYSGRKTINSKDYQVVVRSSQGVTYSVFGGDTQSIYRDSNIVYHYVRKDIASGDIFATISDTSTSEFRLYHKLASAGDTFKTQNIVGAYLFQIVDSLRTIYINNQNHQMYYVKCRSNGFQDYIYVEGLGSLSDPFQLSTAYNTHTFSSAFVSCFKNRYGYLQSTDITLDCMDTSINKYLSISPEWTIGNTPTHKVYPQPAASFVNIDFQGEIGSGKLYLYNQLGQSVYEQKIENQATIKIDKSEKIKGINYYRIIDNSHNKSYSGTVLFQ